MKKLFAALLSMIFVLTGAMALASDDGTAYDAFATFASGASSDACLDEVMSGAFAAAPKTSADAQKMAPKLEQLIAVSTKDISVYAAEKGHTDAKVRDAYYTALANVLDAELMLNPESESRYQDVKALLALQAESKTAEKAKITSSSSSSSSSAKTSASSSKTSSASSSSKTSSGNKNRNTNTPDRNTRNTPNTPDRNTRNTPNTPDRNTRNTPNTPDRNTRNSPDRNT